MYHIHQSKNITTYSKANKNSLWSHFNSIEALKNGHIITKIKIGVWSPLFYPLS